MNDGEIHARLYSTGEPICFKWQKGLITERSTSSTVRPDAWIAPSLLDLQINGFAGVDFQRNSLAEDELLCAARGLQSAGCGRFLLTLITDHWDALLTRLRHLREIRAGSDELRSAIAGWHLEGPFLSPEPGFCGAHNPGLMIDPTPEHIRELKQLTEDDAVLITIAPERAQAIDTIALAVSLGMTVSLGHTNASAELLRRAVRAGARGFTHFANACPQDLDRHDNILWRVLDTPGLTISLIPDTHHVSPPLFRLAHRAYPEDRIYYTTDAVSAAGAAPGRYSVGRHQVDVGPDQIVRQPGGTNYAGSGLRPIDGVLRAAEMLGRPWQKTWDFLSVAPARLMGWATSLEVGQPASFCILKQPGKGPPSLVRSVVRGIDAPLHSPPRAASTR